MARWVPPIPTERLYSAPAMELGAGLALLVWCYDGVERDGTVKIELDAAAAALGKPYRTVKEWWRLLREGPFFSSVKDRGKLGFVATFDRDWIEWRVMATNYPPVSVEGQPDVLDEDSRPRQGPVKAPSRADDGQPDVLEDPAYKVLITPVQASIAPVASDDAPARPPRTKKPKAEKPDEPPTPIAIRQAIADACAIDLDGGMATRGQVMSLNTEAKRIWTAAQAQGKVEAECVDAIRYVAGWIKRTVYPYSNGQPLKPAALLERWRAAMDAKPKTNGVYTNGTNGHHAPERMPTPEETAAAARLYRPRIPGRTAE